MSFWSRLFQTPSSASASDAARTLAARAARQRAVEAITIAERRMRLAAELRRSGARSPIPSRDEVVAPIRAARARRKEKEHG